MTHPYLLTDYMIKASFAYWTAVCYPALYLARRL